MTIEEELTAGMREHTAGLTPSGDLLDRAARRHRRRNTVMGVGTGVFALAAVAAVTLSALGGGPAPAVTAGPVASAAPQLLTVAQVSQRVLAALAADDVQHVNAVITLPAGVVDHDEQWYDTTSGQARSTGRNADGSPRYDNWVVVAEGVMTNTHVDHRERTWTRAQRPVTDGRITGPMGATPDELRAALARGDGYQLLGPETLDGRQVLHLRRTNEDSSDDLWVDATTYRAVRRDIVKRTPDGDVKVQLDFEWLTRNADALTPFTVTVPDGYTEQILPPTDGPI